MGFNKILFVKDIGDDEISSDLLKGIISIKQLHLEEIVIMQASSASGWQKPAGEAGLKIRQLLVKKLAVDNILSGAVKEQVSLIIFATDRKGIHGKLFRKLIAKSSLPILFFNNVDKNSVSGQERLFSHAVFATDWSSAAEKALDYLFDLKIIIGELEIVNVINKKLTVKDMRELKDRLSVCRRGCLEQNINAESHIYAGKTHSEIMLAARDYKATIIVMGGKKKESTLKNIFRKSSSFMVSRESILPVLVIP